MRCKHIKQHLLLVGVVGSGKGMTTYQQRGKHIYSAASTTEEG